eukprot:5949101-Alexandrium_andersonii.AAC.1
MVDSSWTVKRGQELPHKLRDDGPLPLHRQDLRRQVIPSGLPGRHEEQNRVDVGPVRSLAPSEGAEEGRRAGGDRDAGGVLLPS